MSNVIDISRGLKLPANIAKYVRPFSAGPANAEIAAVAQAAVGKHADAALIARTGASAALWREHAARFKVPERMVADAIRARFEPWHADAGSSLPPLALRNQIGPDIFQPSQDYGDILDTIPARSVPGFDVGYWRNFVKLQSGGGVITVSGDQTKFNTVGYAISQELRPLHMAGIAISRGWMEQRQTGAAGVNDMGNKMLALRRAFREYFIGVRLNGIAGLDCHSLASVPGLLRWNSPYVFGTATIAQMQAEIVNILTRAAELSPADLKPDTVILTDRIWNRMMGTTALPYSTDDGLGVFRKALSEIGINRIVVGKSLRDYGGTSVDGLLAIRSGGVDGMAQVQGLEESPVWTYQDASGEVTIYVSSYGDLEQPVAEGSLLALIEVT